MFTTLRDHAAKHALFYAIAIGLGFQSFGTAFYDNFYNVPPANMAELGWWQVAALVMKSMSFAVGCMVGYLIKSPEVKNEEAHNESLNPPQAVKP